jgi:SAM-dependent methyltransferase
MAPTVTATRGGHVVEANPWRDFFNAYAAHYMDEVFTRGTVGEVEFLIEELDLAQGARILDVGCGTARHALELANRGYRVTGIDISTGMLAEASRAAREQGVEVELIEADATDFTVAEPFDAAVCLCEGAFCLLCEADDPVDRDLAILRCVHDALRSGGRFMLTALSAFPLVRRQGRDDAGRGDFDPITMVETEGFTWETPAGSRTIPGRQRVYVPTELALLFRLAGFEVEHIWGGSAGSFGRRPIDLDDWELMVVARRP